MRIAIDIDSTLHHYWDVLSDVSRRRFGIELPYEEQFSWGITRLRPEQLALCIAESHCEERILRRPALPGRGRGRPRLARAGPLRAHHEPPSRRRAPATRAGSRSVGLPFDDLHCSFDKVARCVELDIDLLIDDSPGNLSAALEHGMRAATLVHPWNRDILEEEDILAAEDWSELARLLEPVLAAGARVRTANLMG